MADERADNLQSGLAALEQAQTCLSDVVNEVVELARKRETEWHAVARERADKSDTIGMGLANAASIEFGEIADRLAQSAPQASGAVSGAKTIRLVADAMLKSVDDTKVPSDLPHPTMIREWARTLLWAVENGAPQASGAGELADRMRDDKCCYCQKHHPGAMQAICDGCRQLKNDALWAAEETIRRLVAENPECDDECPELEAMYEENGKQAGQIIELANERDCWKDCADSRRKKLWKAEADLRPLREANIALHRQLAEAREVNDEYVSTIAQQQVDLANAEAENRALHDRIREMELETVELPKLRAKLADAAEHIQLQVDRAAAAETERDTWRDEAQGVAEKHDQERTRADELRIELDELRELIDRCKRARGMGPDDSAEELPSTILFLVQDAGVAIEERDRLRERVAELEADFKTVTNERDAYGESLKELHKILGSGPTEYIVNTAKRVMKAFRSTVQPDSGELPECCVECIDEHGSCSVMDTCAERKLWLARNRKETDDDEMEANNKGRAVCERVQGTGGATEQGDLQGLPGQNHGEVGEAGRVEPATPSEPAVNALGEARRRFEEYTDPEDGPSWQAMSRLLLACVDRLKAERERVDRQFSAAGNALTLLKDNHGRRLDDLESTLDAEREHYDKDGE